MTPEGQPPPGLAWEDVPHTGWDGPTALFGGKRHAPRIRRAKVPGGWFVAIGYDLNASTFFGWFYPDPDHRWLAG